MAHEHDPRLATTISACIYGLSNSWKTGVASCFPGKKVAYIAAEPVSLRMDSWFGPRPTVIVPDGNWDREKKSLNYREETFDLCQRDWKAEGYDTVVWDTWTFTNNKILMESAIKQWFSEKGPVTGPRDPRLDIDRKYAQPQMGDFMLAQQLGLQAMTYLVTQSVNVIVICHEGLSEADPAKGELALFGPQTCGGKGPRQFPHLFSATLWFNRENSGPGTVVSLRTREKHIAGVKTTRVEGQQAVPDMRAIKSVEDAKAFWQWMIELKGAQE